MKDDNDDWSVGQFESAATYVPANETDCSGWDAEDTCSEWSEGKFKSAAIPVPGAAAGFTEASPFPMSGRIGDDSDLAEARECIANVLDKLVQLRANGDPEEFARTSGTYRAEVERLQKAVLDYLTRGAKY